MGPCTMPGTTWLFSAGGAAAGAGSMAPEIRPGTSRVGSAAEIGAAAACPAGSPEAGAWAACCAAAVLRYCAQSLLKE